MARLGPDLDKAPLALGDLPDQVQSNAHTLLLPVGCSSIEPLEDLGLLFLGDPRAGILDQDRGEHRIDNRCDADPSAGGSVLHGVVQ